MTVLAGASSSAFDQPGTLGFLVVAGMGVILVFLFRSMTKHLRKVSGAGRGSGFPGQAGPLGQSGPLGPGNGSSSTGAGQPQAGIATVAPTGAADHGGVGGAASGDGAVPGDTGASGSAF